MTGQAAVAVGWHRSRQCPRSGEPAPDFELVNQFGEPVRLSDFRGRNVVLVFYPFAFSGICTGELCEIRDNLALFEDADAAVLAVSVDSKFAQRAYAEKEGYAFDLLGRLLAAWRRRDTLRRLRRRRAAWPSAARSSSMPVESSATSL